MKCFSKKVFVGWLALGVVMFLQSCNPEDKAPGNYLFELKNVEDTGVDFVNELPVELDLNIFNYLYYYNGGGLAVGDFNNDSLPDLYFTSNLGKERMFLNKGNLRFEDVSEFTNVDGGANAWSTGASVVDINGDDLLDIYLCQVGAYRKLDNNNKLFICTGFDSLGIPQYEESAKAYGLDFKGFSTHAGFLDYDLDGDLDMYLLNHSVHQNGTFGPRKRFLNTIHATSGDKLFQNNDGYFKDVTESAGIQSSVIGYGLGLAFGDVNLDGYPDIYVGNDFHENDYLYINQKDGTFKEDLNNQIRHTSKFTMGVDIADINNDAHPDIFSLDMLPEDPVILKRSLGEEALDVFRFKLNYGYNRQFAKNALQLNTGNGTFSEIGRYSGIFATDWSWSPLWLDMNLDGQQDLFVSNGIPKRMNDMDYIDFRTGNDIQYKVQFDQVEEEDLSLINMIPEIKIRNKFFVGDSTLRFEDSEARIHNDKISYSNSAAYADLDNDGDLDVVTNNIDDPAFLYENLTENAGKRSLTIHLRGKGKNTGALGAKVLVYQGPHLQFAEHFQVKGFQSSNLSPLVFAKIKSVVDSVVVIWPDNTSATIKSVSSAELFLEWQDDLPIFDFKTLHKRFACRWESREEELGVNYVHQENPFVEFDREALIPFSTSTEGPALAIGDLNGDGRDDIFVGGAKWQTSGLFYQQSDGSFQRIYNEAFNIDSTYEDIHAVIEDMNNDGAADLVIATGGNEFPLNNEFTEPLLYLNDGQGNLYRKREAFKGVNLTSGGLVVADFNGDGTPDIFLGGRAIPWAYGEVPRSFLLLNDGAANFSDASEEWLTESGTIGFVKNVSGTDLDRDGDQDILLALEWDGVKVLFNEGDHFEVKTLFRDHGWWNYILPFDADGDGDIDLLACNQGLNTRLKSRPGEPVRMYYADFDDNGTKEQLLSYYVKGKKVPFHNKKELQEQLPFVKKKFVYAKDFAEASFEDIFPSEKLRNYFEASEFRSFLLINNGSQRFEASPLPWMAQQAPYYAATVIDINRDEKPDILLMGNYQDANIKMGPYDNNYGTLLMNKGGGNFEVTEPGGDIISGEVKQISPINIDGHPYLVMARNNGSLKIVKFDGLTN